MWSIIYLLFTRLAHSGSISLACKVYFKQILCDAIVSGALKKESSNKLHCS